jgi:Homeodomain-like domain
MKLHANARTCPKSTQLPVDRIESGWSVPEAAEAAGVTARTARRWLARWRASRASEHQLIKPGPMRFVVDGDTPNGFFI